MAPSLPRVLPLCVQARVDSSAGARLCAAESLRIVGYRSRSSPTASFGRGDGKREDGQRFFQRQARVHIFGIAAGGGPDKGWVGSVLGGGSLKEERAAGLDQEKLCLADGETRKRLGPQ